jgi:hypothetical protein
VSGTALPPPGATMALAMKPAVPPLWTACHIGVLHETGCLLDGTGRGRALTPTDFGLVGQ